MTDKVSVNLYPAQGYKVDIAPFIIVVDELFPTIISSKYQPRIASDMELNLQVRKDVKKKQRYHGVFDLLVQVVIHDDTAQEVDADTVGRQLVKGLFDVLAGAVDLELVVVINNEEVAWFTTDDLAAGVLPTLQDDPDLAAALDRVFKRIIAEDPNLELDPDTGIIRVLTVEQLEPAPA